jgi:parallel beta-helix repeat protein
MKNKFLLSSCLVGFFFLISMLSSTAQTVYVVTDSIDGNSPGQLRYAMNQAAVNPGSSVIRFNFASPGTNPVNIVLNSTYGVLPTLTKTVVIDGTSQPGYTPTNSRVRIVGEIATGTYPTGFAFLNAPGSKLLGIRLYGFTTGISIKYSDNCEIRNCSINRCDGKTIELFSSSYCVIKGNNINTDKTGVNLNPAPDLGLNSDRGIFISNNGTIGSSNNIIGGTECGEANTICYIESEGIDNDQTLPALSALNVGNKISANKIYENKLQAIGLKGSNGNILAPTITGASACITTGTTTTPFGIIEVFSGTSSYLPGDPNTWSNSRFKKNARIYLGTTTANGAGNWSLTMGLIPTDSITATVTSPVTNSTSGLSVAYPIGVGSLGFGIPPGTGNEGAHCIGEEIKFSYRSAGCPNTKYIWDFGDGSPSSENPSHMYAATGSYTVTLSAVSASGCILQSVSASLYVGSTCPPPCSNCIGSFAPDPGDYIISGWVKKETTIPADVNYTTPKLIIAFPGTSNAGGTFSAKGQIIDGWQRIEEKFTVVAGSQTIDITLNCASGSGNCLFDDIRIFPLNGSMKSFVYDPITMRLVAELDERNYSTFYEYDEEGKLIRVKKETEKGVMTIKENRNNTNKR